MNRQKLFYKLGLLCTTRKYLILAFVSIATAIFSYFAFQIEINLGVLSLLEDNDPEVTRVQYAIDNFGGMDYTFIAVTADTLYHAEQYADALAGTLAGSDMVLRVIHKMDADALMKYGFLFLEMDEIRDFRRFAAEYRQDLVHIFRDVHTAGFLTGFNRMIERQIIEKDEIEEPSGVVDLLDSFNRFLTVTDHYFNSGKKTSASDLKRSLIRLFFQGSSNPDLVFESEYMLSKDKQTVLLLVMPAEPGGDMVFINRFMNYLNRTAAHIAAGIPGADFWIAGNAAIIYDEYQAVRRDTMVSTVVTFILVLIIFFVFFRRLSDLLLIAICLIVGLIWTYGLTQIHIGYLGITTAFFSAILIGLSIDFAIHLLARYSEYRSRGKDIEEAVALAMAGSGPGILVGSATTAGAFFVLITCRFKGISQLGFVAGMGMLSVTVIMFTLLPCMIAIRDSHGFTAGNRFRPLRELSVLSGLSDGVVRHKWIVLILVLLLTSGMTLAAAHIRFNYDFRSLEPKNSIALKANHHLEAAFGRSVDFGLVFADSVEDSRRLAEILKTKPSVSEVHDISGYIPENQPEKAILITPISHLLEPVVVEKIPLPEASFTGKEISDLAFSLRESGRMFLAVKQIAILDGNLDIEDQCTRIIAHAQQLAGQVETAGTGLLQNIHDYQLILAAELQNLLANLKTAARAEPLGINQLPQVIRDHFMGKDGRFKIYAYPEGYIWTRDQLRQITEDLRSVSDESTSSGILFMELVNKTREDFKSAVWLSLLMVFVLVLASFRRMVTTVLVLIPLVLGVLWMTGTMVLLGMSFNLVNIAVIPILIGIGIDDGIHFIHRYRTEQTDRIHHSVRYTGRAIFLTSITTMAGFGSLSLASYNVIATFGWVLLIGVFYCMISTLVVLPVLLSILEHFNIKI